MASICDDMSSVRSHGGVELTSRYKNNLIDSSMVSLQMHRSQAITFQYINLFIFGLRTISRLFQTPDSCSLSIKTLYQQQMSVSSRSTKKDGSSERQDPSKVLLVCVYDTLIIEITNDMIHEKFRKYGHIAKLLIFQKAQVTKFFIEYAQLEQAIKAKRELEGSKLLQAICKINIYYSNFSNVDLKNQTSEGADYSSEEQLHQNFIQKYDLLTKSSPQQDADGFNDLLMQSFHAFSPFSRSKTDNPVNLAKQIREIDFSKDEKIGEENQFDFQIKSSIQSILNSNSNSSRSDKFSQKHQTPPKETNSSSSRIKLKQNTNTSSPILFFQLARNLQIRHIYNLFSNFGNIAGICKKRHLIYIKFRTIEFAAISFTYLNQYTLMGNLLKLAYAQNQLDFTPKENQFCELIYFDNSYDRFTPNKSITINAPSKTLHVSSLKKEICREKVLRSIFEQHGEVETVHILKQSADKNMALVKFYSFEDSFRAIAELHNCIYSGRKMQISFTKSRI